MSDDDTVAQFFQAGLEHYAQAASAVEEFEARLKDKLKSALVARESAACVRLLDDAGPRFERGTLGASRFLYGMVAIAIGSPSVRGRIEIGVWWNPPFAASGRYAYAGIYDVPWATRLSEPPGFQGKTHRQDGITFLALELTPSSVLDVVLQELLDQLDAACRTELGR